jgi:proteic killer suppression protein
MEIKFDKKYLSELYYDGKCNDKKYRFQPQVVKKYKKCIDLLENVPGVESLYKYNALHYEALQGDKKGLESVRVNDQYRIEFSTAQIESETIITVCNIVELSNHYK